MQNQAACKQHRASIMHNSDDAVTAPGSGNMSWSEGKLTQEPHELAHSFQKQLEGQQTLQRILVVEDDPTLATLEAEILTAHGYSVVTVNSGELAIATLRRSIPDLVVLDLELIGNINGWDVLRELRASSAIPVLLTTSATGEVRKYIHGHGETRFTLDHLPKPYPMQTFLKRVKRMLTITPRQFE
jgi:CheY-like chemotaxis protein